MLALPAGAVHAQDVDAGPNVHHEAARVIAEELAMAQATARLNELSGERPADLADALRHELATDAASYDFRAAARAEQSRIYEIAGYSSVETAVLPLLSSDLGASLTDVISMLHSIYILAGIDQYYLVNPHLTHAYTDARPISSLRSYYLEAQQRYGIDGSYLAAINYIESNFGRINGPSSAGALGPMQFEPGTWQEYGNGGNVMDPHDSILAAARYLAHNGAPYDMRNAIYHYNLDYNYVDAVESLAHAFRGNPGWLDRVYYWNTFG
ncbi:MAG TPA: lytic transglycosylase domain-containing protein [Candidatus Dormibacteraeota bacterium]|nr:lytic transglycosylase domain-containing protein [Candidatus Dormibacteraeota bacterium]